MFTLPALPSCRSLVFGAIALAGISACSDQTTDEAATPETAAAVEEVITELAITEASFDCIRDLESVRGFYVGNVLGDLDATLAVAHSETGGVYPPGSLIQLVPGEAMVKHNPGYNAATKDWEFFELDVSPTGTAIKVRGTTEAVNQFGGNCLSCHIKANAEFDMVCEQNRGCDPIPVTPIMAKAIQNTDPRCEAVELPDDQKQALAALAAALGQGSAE